MYVMYADMYTTRQLAIQTMVLIQEQLLMIFQMTGHVQLVALEKKVFLLNKPEIHDRDLSFEL
jgi:hypothetical protein